MMGKGMFIQCHGCGYTEHVSLEGNFDAREKELQRMLDEGWRWAVNWQGFLCPKCFRGDPCGDALYRAYAGKPKLGDLFVTYLELRERADEQIEMLRSLG